MIASRPLLSPDSQAKLQELRASKDFCCIHLSSDYDYVWDIELVWDTESPRKPPGIHGHHPIRPCWHSHEELDEAILHAYQYWKDPLWWPRGAPR